MQDNVTWLLGEEGCLKTEHWQLRTSNPFFFEKGQEMQYFCRTREEAPFFLKRKLFLFQEIAISFSIKTNKSQKGPP